MTPMEIYASLVLVVATVITFSILWKFKKMKEQRSEMDAKFAMHQANNKARIDRENERERQRAELRKHPLYGHARFDPTNPDVLLPIPKKEIAKKYGTISQTQSVSGNSIGIQSRGSTTTVIHDASSDMLTNMLLYKMMSDPKVDTATVNYDEDTGRVEMKTYERSEPKEKEESSYSSSYSSSSSSDDDDSRRSSYSSSYSSSSSDSSYSSSSSDSSYSSSSSSSWD